MSESARLFYDDLNDALRVVSQALGGSKVTGCRLWPDKAADAAARHLSDCLNPSKAEKLSPDQVLLLLRWGHEIGCHAAMQYLGQQAGYEVVPISPDAQKDRLADAILEGARTLERAMRMAEQIKAAQGPRLVA